MPILSPSTRLPGPLAAAVNRLLRIDQLDELYRGVQTLVHPGEEAGSLCGALVRELAIRVTIAPQDLARIPVEGPVVAVANHPFGLLDGVLLTSVLLGVRHDVRVLTNRLLADLPEIREVGIFIDPFDHPESAGANATALRSAVAHLRAGGLLLVFPAGEVSRFNLFLGGVRDPAWRTTAARLARMTQAKAVPILIPGSNSIPFHMLGMIHSGLRTAALPAELLNKRGRSVEVRIGNVIEPRRFQKLGDAEAATRYLRLRSDLLARRNPGKAAEPDPTGWPAVPISVQGSRGELTSEVEALAPGCLLEETKDLAVYLAESDRIPNVLNEIGRLREITFRAAGEGTGADRDLDRFDPYYEHLFLWNRAKQEVVGAYRLGDIPRILATRGRRGLYTDSLFRFAPGFLENLGPCFELGRSFVRPEYQKQFGPLLLLWKGICECVWRRPEYATLIGAVSISNHYSTASRTLIAKYFENFTSPEERKRVKPRRPLRRHFAQEWEIKTLCSLIPDVEGLCEPIADLEPDGKGVPVLVRQYARLGARLLAFSCDPAFGNTLDGFLTLDLRQTAPEILSRYMGQNRAARFLEWQKALHPRVAGVFPLPPFIAVRSVEYD